MAIEMQALEVTQLEDVAQVLRGWQRDEAPSQLHPGDLGWGWRTGAGVLATQLRIWAWGGEIVAIGYLDSPDVLRLTVSPAVWTNNELAARIVVDVSDPQGGVLPAGKVAVEVPDGTRVKQLMLAGAWSEGESWTPLRLDLEVPVAEPTLGVEVVESADQVSECTAVHRSAWASERFTDESWHAMAAGSPFGNARCLLARDANGVPVATLTAWSAGAGRPGLIEPLGVHADHRRHGYGTAICVAAGAHLRAMGSTSVLVCTPTSLHSAIATYEAAGYERLPQRLDVSRQT